MALNTDQLKADLLAAFKKPENEKDPKVSQTILAQELAKAIDKYVRAADVKGVVVSLEGGLTANQTGTGKLG